MKEKGNNYIISGGREGKERLHLLSDIMNPYTKALLETAGPIGGKTFLDLGCGGGHVTFMAADMVGETGRVTGIDFDREIIALNQKEAQDRGAKNVLFLDRSAYDIAFHNEFDIAYARFLLSHLTNPGEVLQNMLAGVKPGGRIVVEDIQFSGHFCYPACEAFEAYVHYFSTAARNNGHNAETGASLFELFNRAGIADVGFDVIQPCFNTGAGKWMAYITMDKIKNTVLKQGLAEAQTIDAVLKELEDFTKDERTIISLPRVFRVWGVKR